MPLTHCHRSESLTTSTLSPTRLVFVRFSTLLLRVPIRVRQAVQALHEQNVMIFANVVFLVGSVLCAAATSSAMFIAGRAVSGAGFAGIISGFFTMLTHIVALSL